MRITTHVAALVALVLAAASVASAAVLDVPVTPLVVRLYDAQALPPSASESALHETRTILAEAGFALQWVPCAPTASAAERCAVPLGGAELVVRLVTAPHQASLARPLRGPHRACAVGCLPLGYSLVDGGTQAGSLATIYLDRVKWLAAASTADLAALLGRAIAHEIGHLLLGTTRHGRLGVMRAIWTRDSLRNSRPNEWRFSAHEARQMRAAVGARGAANEAARLAAGSGQPAAAGDTNSQ